MKLPQPAVLAPVVALALMVAQSRTSAVETGWAGAGRTPVDLMLGRGEIPFQLRTLVPWIARGFYRVAGIGPLTVSFVVDALAGVLYALCVLALAARLAGLASHERDAFLARVPTAPYVVFLPVLAHYVAAQINAGFYPYDLPAVAFAAGCYLLQFEKRWPAYYALFVLGAFNRESILVVAFAHAYTNLRTRNVTALFAHGLVSLALWAAVRATVFTIYRANPGHAVWLTERDIPIWVHNVLMFGDAAVHRPFEILLLFGGLWLPVFRARAWRLHPFLADAFRALLFPTLPILFFTAFLLEKRVLSEMVPVFATAALVAMATRAPPAPEPATTTLP